MNRITLIAAIGKNRELGKNNDLIWSIPEDLKFFRENTVGKPIVMGLNTLNSLPRLLPNRRHIVLSHVKEDLDPAITVFYNLDDLLEYILSLDEEVMIIGGASIYGQFIDHADKMLLTEINEEAMADVYFPEFSYDDWDREVLSSHIHEDIEYNHVAYTRKRVKK